MASGVLHEDEAAGCIARSAVGAMTCILDSVEGRGNTIAEADGLMKIDMIALKRINAPGQIAF